MALGNITITTAAEFIQKILALEVIKELGPNLVLANLVTRLDSLTVGKNKGDGVNIPHISSMTAKDKEANTAMTAETITEGKTTLLLNKYKYSMFEIEDIVTLQSQHALRQLYAKQAAECIAKAIDSDLAAAMWAGAASAVDAGAAVTYANLRACRLLLQAADISPLDRSLVLQSDAEDDVLNLSEIKGRGDYLDAATPSVVQSGRIARILGAEVFASENMPESDVSAVTKTHNLFFQKGAMALAIQQQPTVEISREHKDKAWAVSVCAVYGVKVLRDVGIVDLQRNA